MSDTAPASTALPTTVEVARLIDHAILKPETTREEVDAQLDLAGSLGLCSVCVRPVDVAHAVARLEGTGVLVGTVIGFPHGSTSTAAKVAESRRAIADGASELDMVQQIGLLRSGLTDAVEDDVRAVVEAADGRVVKVILETAYLTDDEIVAGSRAAEAGGASFVKTSTGFGGGGATVHHLTLMRDAVSEKVLVKASGGVRDLDTLLIMRALGVDRFGTSASATILADLAARIEGGTAHARTDAASY